MPDSHLKVVVCTARRHGAVLRVINAIKKAEPDGRLSLVGVIFDEGKQKPNRYKKFRRWVKKKGWSYALYRLYLTWKAGRYPSPSIDLFEICREHQIPIHPVPSINAEEAKGMLKTWRPDIGVSSGNRIIHKSVFEIPRLGMINLHHGKMPEYRGGPPGFWEMYNHEEYMGITVHKIDAKLDNGKILGQKLIPIDYETDTPGRLYQKAGRVDGKLIVEVLNNVWANESDPPQSGHSKKGKVYTLPGLKEIRFIGKQLNRPIDPIGYRAYQ